MSAFLPSEWATAVAFGCAVLAGAGMAAHAASLDKPANAREIDPGIAMPVRVIPVLDMDAPLLKLGGKANKAKLPDRWLRQTPKARVEEKAFVSTKASKSASDVPEKPVPVASASAKPPPENAEVTKQVDTPIDAVVDAGPEPNVDTKGAADGVKEGTETDPLKARAVDLYRARIISWFTSRFHVHGTGIPQDALTKLHVSATVQLGSDLSVKSYTMTSSGNSAYDAAAKSTLDGAVGQTIPPPPENYPDTVQGSISLTFVCKENKCD